MAVMSTLERPPTPLDRIAEAEIRRVADAVCAELGIAQRERARRAAVKQRIASAYALGPRQPLDLVRAGLDA